MGLLDIHRKKRPVTGALGFVFTQATAVLLLTTSIAGYIISDNQRLGATVRNTPTKIDQPIKWQMPAKYRTVIQSLQARPILKRKYILGRLRTVEEKDRIRGRITRGWAQIVGNCLMAKWEARTNGQAFDAKQHRTLRDWSIRLTDTGANICIRPVARIEPK